MQWAVTCKMTMDSLYIQPIADRVAQNLEIISETFSTYQTSAHGTYDWYHVRNGTNHKSHENPGTKFKVFRENLKILCHPICNRLWLSLESCTPTLFYTKF